MYFFLQKYDSRGYLLVHKGLADFRKHRRHARREHRRDQNPGGIGQSAQPENQPHHVRNDGEGQLGILAAQFARDLQPDFHKVRARSNHFCFLNQFFGSEDEKMQRWQEIKVRQHRLKMEAEQTSVQPVAHIEQIMKSGFSMSDIKGRQCRAGIRD